jgi:hypothetical protein
MCFGQVNFHVVTGQLTILFSLFMSFSILPTTSFYFSWPLQLYLQACWWRTKKVRTEEAPELPTFRVGDIIWKFHKVAYHCFLMFLCEALYIIDQLGIHFGWIENSKKGIIIWKCRTSVTLGKSIFGCYNKPDQCSTEYFWVYAPNLVVV